MNKIESFDYFLCVETLSTMHVEATMIRVEILKIMDMETIVMFLENNKLIFE